MQVALLIGFITALAILIGRNWLAAKSQKEQVERMKRFAAEAEKRAQKRDKEYLDENADLDNVIDFLNRLHKN